MYYVRTKYPTMSGEPHLGYQVEEDLIEADGEAEVLFLMKVVYDQCPSQYFTAIDWVSDETIDLDIADYIGQNTYNLFESCFMQLDEDYEVSYTKAESMYLACIQHTSRRKK